MKNTPPIDNDGIHAPEESTYENLQRDIDNKDFYAFVETAKGFEEKSILEGILYKFKIGKLDYIGKLLLVDRFRRALVASGQSLQIQDLMSIHAAGLVSIGELKDLVETFLDQTACELYKDELASMGIDLATLNLPRKEPVDEGRPVTSAMRRFARKAGVALVGAIVIGNAIADRDKRNSAEEGRAIPAASSQDPETPASSPAPVTVPEPIADTDTAAETIRIGPINIPVALDHTGKFKEKESIAKWQAAGYAVISKTGRDGSPFYVLTMVTEEKEAVFIVSLSDHVEGKAPISARRIK